MIEAYPVVHVTGRSQACEQSELALSANADGVFLISHSNMEYDELSDAFNAVSAHNPNSFIGVNFLDLGSAGSAFHYLSHARRVGAIDRLPDALWVDDLDQQAGDPRAIEVLRRKDPALRSVQLLGGIAFKYTTGYTDDPAAAAQAVMELRAVTDVITTSGAGTGSAASIQKVAAMKRVSGGKPLALASGVTPENIAQYRGYVDKVLVSTGIETEPYSGVFDPHRLRSLITAAHAVQ